MQTVRIEIHKDDGSKIVLAGEALALWMNASAAQGVHWESCREECSCANHGADLFAPAFALAERVPATVTQS